MMKVCVVGNGLIANRFLEDFPKVENLQVVSICVRKQSEEKGLELAKKYGVPKVVTDYAEALADESVDAVYIGITNHMHYEFVKKALEAGKHVICEKPFTVHGWEAHELSDLAREKNLFLWEAFKLVYSPVYQTVKDHLKDIGDLKMVICNYSRVSSRYQKYTEGIVLPAFDPEKAGGCLYDINIYNLHFVTCLYGAPKAVHFYPNYGYNGVDTSGTVILEYPGFHAVCTAAKDSSSTRGALIQGDKAYIRIEGPVSSASSVWLETDKEKTCLLEASGDEKNLVDELRVFVRQFEENDKESCYQMLDHSLVVMDVVDACLK